MKPKPSKILSTTTQKLIMLLGMCILLLSSVSAQVVIWDMPPPVISGKAVSTGADNPLNASDDYYMQCVYQYGTGYYGNFVSPASNQIKVSTDAVNRYINLSWGFYNTTGGWEDGFYVPDGSQTSLAGSDDLNLICKWDYYNMTNATTGIDFQWLNYNDPNYASMTYRDGHRRWTDRYYRVDMPELKYPHTDDVLDDDNLFDGAIDGSNYLGRYFLYPDIAWMEVNLDLYSGSNYAYMLANVGTTFNMTHGKLGIEFTDVNDDWDDLYVALTANESYADRYMISGKHADYDSGKRYYRRQLILFGSIFESTASTDFIEFSGVDITLYGGQIIRARDADFYFDNCILNILHTGWVQPGFKVKSTKMFVSGGTTVLTGTQVVSGFSPWRIGGSSMTIYGYSTLGAYGNLDLADVSFLDFRYPKEGRYLTNMNYYDARQYITLRYNVDVYLYNLSFYNDGGKYNSYDWYEDWYSGQTDPCNIYCLDCVSNRENGTILIRYNDASTPIDYLNYSFQFSHKYHIVGSDGTTPIQNINITETDDNGNVYSVLTDANGDATNIILAYKVIRNNSWTNNAEYIFNHNWTVNITSSAWADKEIIITESGAQTRYIKLDNLTSSTVPTINDPPRSTSYVKVMGTEYTYNSPGTVYAQLLDADGNPENSATCDITIRYPSHSTLASGTMDYISGSNGLYNFSFTAPSTEGVYSTDVNCSNPTAYGSSEFHVSPDLSDIQTDLSNIYSFMEELNSTLNTVKSNQNTYFSAWNSSISDIDTNVQDVETNQDTYFSNWNSYFSGWNTNILNLDDNFSKALNYLALINTTTTDIDSDFDVVISDVGEVLATEKYYVYIDVSTNQGQVDADSVTIDLYDSTLSEIASDVSATRLSEGHYRYSYQTTSSSNDGIWHTIISVEKAGIEKVYAEQWELESNPAQVTLSVTNKIVPGIACRINIENEGSSSQEYQYRWWITDVATGQFDDGTAIDSGSAAKLVDAGDTFSVTRTMTVPSLAGKTYWCKAEVFYGTEKSGASDQFITEEMPSTDAAPVQAENNETLGAKVKSWFSVTLQLDSAQDFWGWAVKIFAVICIVVLGYFILRPAVPYFMSTMLPGIVAAIQFVISAILAIGAFLISNPIGWLIIGLIALALGLWNILF